MPRFHMRLATQWSSLCRPILLRPNAGRRGASAARLAARTIEGGALSLDEPSDRRSARAAGLAGTVVHQQPLREVARLVRKRALAAEGRAHAFDGRVEHVRNLARDGFPLSDR